jgi:hypothetical protein
MQNGRQAKFFAPITTTHTQNLSTNILFPVLHEASNNILWQEYAETCTG